ncbi:hypothetical protein PIB30_079233, partial [Stylosanthes scabra]|nr:hypothetical protein [Stylosanthes scabra]
MTLTYKNKVVRCSSFAEAWELIHDIFTASSNTRIQSIKTQLRDTKKSGTVSATISKRFGIVSTHYTLWAIPSQNRTMYKPSSMDFQTNSKAKSFLKAYESRLNKKAQTLAVAHIAQTNSNFSSQLGRGATGRGNNSGGARNGRGGRYQGNRPQCQLSGKLGHTVHTCYHRYDPHFQGQPVEHD